MKRKNIIASDFYCTQCGFRNIDVWRTLGRERESGHLKKLYCRYCGKEQNCVEIKQNVSKYTFEDFKVEFEYGNFNENGTRKRTYGELKNGIHNGYIKKEKTLPDGGSTWLR